MTVRDTDQWYDRRSDMAYLGDCPDLPSGQV